MRLRTDADRVAEQSVPQSLMAGHTVHSSLMKGIANVTGNDPVNCSGACPHRRISRLAIQQRVGLRPQRIVGPGGIDTAGSVADGKTVMVTRSRKANG